MTKYDVELITDKHGKPMPQYFDDQEGIMKPITKDNFDGTINGSVDVEFPNVQKVEVTNPTDYPTELNVNVNNPVDTVSVDNLPDVQRVEVTNAQTQMDVNVLNPVDNVSVNNLPTDYPDQAVEARLQAIEQTQSQILDKLNDTIDTRLTGSNVEDGITTKTRLPETFFEEGFEVGPGSFVEYNSFNPELKYGNVRDMRSYTHLYFGAQSLTGNREFYIMARQKPYGTSGSIAIEQKHDEAGVVRQIEKTPISFHNLSLRVYNNSDKEQSYIVACGFWPI